MKRIFKILSVALLVYGVTCLVTPFVTILKTRAIENQITFLSEILGDGYDDKLQQRFPEGKIFSNALLALSIIEYSDHHGINSKHYASIVDQCVIRMLSNNAKASFDVNIKPKYGMFYNGWTLLVINTYRASTLNEQSDIKDLLNKESNQIEERLQQAQTDSLRVLDTYSGSNWPADNLIGLVSLSDKSLQTIWLDLIQKATNNTEGLIHHAGFNPNEVRGSSSALITYCLGRISPNKAQTYNLIYRNQFVDSFLGLDLVFEHYDHSSVMDVDSGPIIFGYGASATVMNVKTQASLGLRNGKRSWALLNLLGLPVNLFGKKYYLLQQEPMLDLFLLWGAVEL